MTDNVKIQNLEFSLLKMKQMRETGEAIELMDEEYEVIIAAIDIAIGLCILFEDERQLTLTKRQQ